MKWHVKIWLSPVVQQEPEEFYLESLGDFHYQMECFINAPLGRGYDETFAKLRAIREIRITKAPDAQDLS